MVSQIVSQLRLQEWDLNQNYEYKWSHNPAMEQQKQKGMMDEKKTPNEPSFHVFWINFRTNSRGGEYLALSFNVVLKRLPLGKIFITNLQPTWFVFYYTKPSELFHVFSINLRNGSPDKGWGKRIFGAWKDQPTRLEQSIWDSVGWAIDIMGTIRGNLEYLYVFVYLYIFVFVNCQFFVFRNVGGYWLRIP